MDFLILGSIEAARDGQALVLGGPRQRALLARLLLDANHAVAADRLVEDLWDEPPRDAHAALQNQVFRLRKAIGDRVVTKSPGYLVRVEPGELDLDRFRALVAHAGATADPAERSRLLREADAAFRGSPLGGVDAPFAPAEAAALEELRLAGVEARIDSDLERGRHAELVPELGSLVARHPLRERLRAHQIIALYRSGRQAEALDAYRETKRLLDEELGLEPGPALRELEGAILRQEPSLALRAGPAASEPVAVAPPRRRRRRVAAPLAALALALAAGAAAAFVLLQRDTASTGAPPKTPVAKRRSQQPVVVPPRRNRVPHSTARPTARISPAVKPKPTAKSSVRPTVVRRASPLSRAKPKQPKPVSQPRTQPTPTTTAPAAPAAPAAPKPAPAPAATTRTISDSFDGSQLDGTIWYPIREGSGWSFGQKDGRLEFAFSPAATPGGQWNTFGGHVGTRCKFPGDFDARVDYTLREWPAANGITLTLWGFFGPTNIGWQSWRWSSAQWGEAYGSFTGEGASTSVSLDDPSGTLRLVRRDGVVTASFLHKGGWQELTSGSIAADATIAVGAGQVHGDGRGFAGREVVVDFDNFTVTGQSPSCPAGSQATP